MKSNELHPCDGCRGPLLSPSIANFYVVRSSMAMPDRRAVQQLQGLHTFFGGRAPGLAEVFAPDPHVVKVLGEMDPALYIDTLVCFDCFISKSLMEIEEGAKDRRQKAEEAAAAAGADE